MCGGASSAQVNLQNEESQFYATQIQAYNTAYQNFSELQAALKAQFAPVLAAGPGQMGFTTQELNDLNTQATEGTATGFAKAERAAHQAVAARGGGNDVTNITSGAAGQTDAELAAIGAATQSQEELGIKEAGYAEGRRQYDEAIAGEEGLAAGWNPNSFGSTANSSAQVANSEANAVTEANQSVWQSVMGALGGVAGQWASSGFAH